jgi:16S rRNA processing protein RimM
VTGAAEPPLLEVGRIGKAHGLRGEVAVTFITDRVAERTVPGAELWAGDLRLEVVAARPHGRRWLVSFSGIEDRDSARSLTGARLRAVPVDADDPATVFVHELIGKVVVDQHGADHGPVVAVVENPASDLLELADGRLVPLAFLEEVSESQVAVSVPPGLLD